MAEATLPEETGTGLTDTSVSSSDDSDTESDAVLSVHADDDGVTEEEPKDKTSIPSLLDLDVQPVADPRTCLAPLATIKSSRSQRRLKLSTVGH